MSERTSDQWTGTTSSRVGAVAEVVGVAFFLCAEALYNGYPLVFSDTASYVSSSFSGQVPPDRPIGYAVFLRLTGDHRSLWLSVFAQALLCALTLRLTLVAERGRDGQGPLRLLPIGAILMLGTALPWFTGQIMPDFLTPIGVLSSYVVMVRWEQVSRLARTFAVALLVIACAAHYTNVLLLGGIVSLLLIWSALGRQAFWLQGALRGAVVLVVACFTVVGINFRQTNGELFLTRGGHVFMVARLIESGILQRLLVEHCGDHAYLLCPYRTELPRSLEFFMFDPRSPIHRVGGLEMSKPASMRMVRDAVRYYPGAVVASSIRNSIRQFFTFGTGDGLRRYEEAGEPASQLTYVTPVIRTVLPGDYLQYAASRQERRTLYLLASARRLDALVEWLAIIASAALLLVTVRAWSPSGLALRPALATKLHAFVWLAAAVNAIVCATFTTVADRFQARVVWLFVFACLVSCRRLFDRRLSDHLPYTTKA